MTNVDLRGQLHLGNPHMRHEKEKAAYFVFSLAAAVHLCVFGAVVSPVAPGDIADPATWGGVAPSASDAAAFSVAGTYTATSDMDFSILTGRVSGVVFDFSATPARKVTLSSSSVPFMLSGNGASVEMFGGLWDFSGKGSINSTKSNAHPNSLLRLSSGCVVTNVGKCYVGYGGDTGSAIELTGGSKLYANEVTVNGYANNTRSTLSILSGSTFTYGNGVFALDAGSAQTHGNVASNKVVVSGPGSLLTSTGTKGLTIGSRSEGNCVEVRDGGRLYLQGNRISIGHNTLGASRNRLAVGGGGTIETRGIIAVGDTGGTVGNVFAVEPGGTVIATNGTIYVGGESQVTTGNCMTVENGTLKFMQFIIGKTAGSVSNRVYIAGETTVATCLCYASDRYPIFGNGHHNEFTLDGASLCMDKAVGFGYLSTYQGASNTVRLVNGAKLTLAPAKAFFVGDYATSFGNVLHVSGGSVLECAGLYVASHDNTAVISNGTVKCVQVTGGSVLVGTMAGDGSSNKTGDSIVMQGSTPRIEAAGRMTFDNSAKLRFEIPAEGYDDEFVPIKAGGLLELNDTALAVDADAFRATMPCAKKTFTLATSSGVSIDASALEAANAALPDGCAFSIDGTGKKLLLTLKSSKSSGMILSFK